MITLHHEKETDLTKNGYGSLDDNIVNPEVFWEMNSEFKFSFDYPLFGSNEEITSHITNRNLVRVPVPYMDDQFFRIYRTKEILGYVRVEARHLFYDLIDNLIEDTNIVGKNGLGGLTQLLNATQYAHKFKAFSDIDLTTNMRIVRYNPVKALLDDSEDNTFVNRWGGELYRDNYNIHMRKRLGTNRGIKIEHKKDLLGYEATIDESTIATRIMPKGFDGLLLPEKYVDSPLLDPDNPKIRVVEYSDVMAAIGDYEDYEDAIPLSEAYEELRRLAREEFSVHHVDEPETVIHVDFITLENTKEYEEFSELQEIHQGDTVHVSVPEQGFEITSRLVAFTSDPLRKNHYTSTTLGNHVLEYTSSRTEIDVIRKEIKNTNELALIARQSANGKNSNFWGTADPNTLELNAQIDDTYFQEDGDYFAIWEYVEVNGERYWRKGPNTDFGKEIANQLKNAIEDIEIAQETADEAVDEINTAVSNAGFTSLSDSLTGIQSIANSAQNNSVTAVANAQTALNLASSVQSDVASIDLRVDEIDGTLSLKADSQSLDTLTGRVNLAETNIGINAQGLALKANQSTVDTLAGTVQTLGTEFDIVAGQVNSRVWNTDIQTAIDGIETSGRNYWINSLMWDIENYERIGPYDYYEVTGLKPNTEYTMSINPDINLDSIPKPGSGNKALRINNKKENPMLNVLNILSDRVETFERTVTSTEDGTLFILNYNILQNNIGDLNPKGIILKESSVTQDWTPAHEDTDAKISHIETEWTQMFDSFSQTVAGIDGRVTTNKQTLDNISSTVSGHGGRISTVEQTAEGLQTTVADKASQTQVTQLSDLLSSTVEDVEGNTTQISQNTTNINLRVAKGDVISQINTEAERILIQSDKLLLNANNTVITGTAWMDGAIIANASIDGAKIQDATIGSAKIANLDVNKLSGNTAEFIQAGFNDATGNYLRIQGKGLDFHDNLGRFSGTIQTYYQGDTSGVGMFIPDNQIFTIARIDANGNPTRELLTVRPDWNTAVFNSEISMNNRIDMTGNFINGVGRITFNPFYNFQITGSTYGDGPPIGAIIDRNRWDLGTGTNESWTTQMSIRTSGVTLHNDLHLNNNRITTVDHIQWQGGDFSVSAPNGRGLITSSNPMKIASGNRNSWSDRLEVNVNGVRIWQQLNMSGYNIVNLGEFSYISDERVKTNIKHTQIDSLREIQTWEFVKFDRTDIPQHTDIGIIAQDTPSIANYDVQSDIWSVNGSKQKMMNSHAIQQLAFMEENTNKVASQALQATETNAQKIERLEKRIEELESVA